MTSPSFRIFHNSSTASPANGEKMRLIVTIVGIALIAAALVPPSPQQLAREHEERCTQPLMELAARPPVDASLAMLAESEQLQMVMLSDLPMQVKTERCEAFIKSWGG